VTRILKALRTHTIGQLGDHFLRVVGVFDGAHAYRGPAHVQIDLTADCNNTCIACWIFSPLLPDPRPSPQQRRTRLPLGMVEELLDEIAHMGATEVYFSGGGEPFMYPHIHEVLARTKRLGMRCFVNTNFTLLGRDDIDALVDIGVDDLTVSVWAGRAETYCRVHPGRTEAEFRKIEENLRYLNERKRRRTGKPVVKIYHVIFNMNHLEVQEMFDFTRRTSCEHVEYTVADTMPGGTDSLALTEAQRRELCEAWNGLVAGLDRNLCCPSGLQLLNADLFQRRISVGKDVEEARYDRHIVDSVPCTIGWLFARVLPDGVINSCLKAHRIPTGTLFRNRFSEIWNCDRQMTFRTRTRVLDKSDPFFLRIGNDPDTQEAGCYKSCDDIGRNLRMEENIRRMTRMQRLAARATALLMRWIERLRPPRSEYRLFARDPRLAGIVHGRRAFTGPRSVLLDVVDDRARAGESDRSPTSLSRSRLLELVDEIKALGAEEVLFSAAWHSRYPGLTDEMAARAHRHGLRTSAGDHAPAGAPSDRDEPSAGASTPCYVGWILTRILDDGSVVPCRRGEGMVLGNITASSLEEIWYSDRYDELRSRGKYAPASSPFFDRLDCRLECGNVHDNLEMHRVVEELAEPSGPEAWRRPRSLLRWAAILGLFLGAFTLSTAHRLITVLRRARRL